MQKFFFKSSILFLIIAFSSCAFKARNSSIGMSGENLIALNKAAKEAKISNPHKKQYMFFKFTENQKAHFSNVRYKKSGAGLSVRISFSKNSISKSMENVFAMGFLFDDDFSNGTLKTSIYSRKLITGNFSDFESEDFRVVFSIAQNDIVPAGFFVYGNVKFKVTEAQITEAALGWENENIPLFAFGPNGGKIKWDFNSADFSDAKNLFPDQNIPTRIMPKIEIGISAPNDIGIFKNQKRVLVTAGEEKFSIRLSKNENSKTLQTSALKSPFEKIELQENKELVKKLIMKSSDSVFAQDTNGKVLFPLKTDLGLVNNWPQKNWRRNDYELFEWELFPGVLFFDFADYKIQNQFFTRIAYFVEKAGYKGTLVSDDFVENKHGYNAHDYKADDLANFFSLVEQENFQINSYEEILKEILIANKIIQKDKDEFKAGKGAVVSFSRESPEYLRHTFMAHESWHGIYFTDESFRNLVATCYNMFDEDSLNFLKKFWETQPGLGYDTNNEYLMQNEFMAYIMQQSFSNVRNYFLQLAGRGSVNRIQPESAEYIRNTNAQAFVDAAEILNSYAFDNWGLACGRVALVQRLD
ncbi:hypothetical protein [Treponema sp. UBA6852]|uniref:hypothetical protein n=1 Tax=Treponema sp. UBA6852 TaxID=1947744 RepID=UPI0025E2C9E8|nr:hypothetical protein [Treponema sp. UBA6852]